MENLISSLSFAPNIYFIVNSGEIPVPRTLHLQMGVQTGSPSSPGIRNHKNEELSIKICWHSYTLHGNQCPQNYTYFCQEIFTNHQWEVVSYSHQTLRPICWHSVCGLSESSTNSPQDTAYSIGSHLPQLHHILKMGWCIICPYIAMWNALAKAT